MPDAPPGRHIRTLSDVEFVDGANALRPAGQGNPRRNEDMRWSGGSQDEPKRKQVVDNATTDTENRK
jgi:hypothetical protein